MADLELYKTLDLKVLKELLLSKGKKVLLKKKDYFCSIGEPCPYLAYVFKGGFKYTHDNSKGKECVLSFALEQELIGGYTAAQNESKAIYCIQAIEDSIIYQLPIKDVNRLLPSICTSKDLRMLIAELLAFELTKRMISIVCDTPEERYLKLLKQAPTILNRTSLRNVASYLNITPEALSRMRTRMLKL